MNTATFEVDGMVIQREEDKKYFISDLESAPWFDCK